MIAVKFFVLVFLISNAFADYLECFVCEDCDENEEHYEYCPPLEDIESEGGATATADITTAFTNPAAGDNSFAYTPLQPTTAEATLTQRPASVNTTQTTIAVTTSNYTNSTSTISSTAPIEGLTTVDETLVNTFGLGETTISSQTSAGATDDNSAELITIAAEDSTVLTLNATEAAMNIETTAGNTSETVTLSNVTAMVLGTSHISRENVTDFVTLTMQIDTDTTWDVEVEQTTVEPSLEANITTIAEDMTTAALNQSLTELHNTTELIESLENNDVNSKNFTFLTELELESTTEVGAQNVTENSTLNTIAILGNFTTREPDEISAGIGSLGVIQESYTSFMDILNSTISPYVDVNGTGVLGLMESSSALLTNTIASVEPYESGVTSENFGNLTTTEGANDTAGILELDKPAVGVSINIATNGRPNSTTQIGIGYGIFDNTTTERPNDAVEIGLTDENSLSTNNSQDSYLNATEELVFTGSTGVYLPNITESLRPSDLSKPGVVGGNTTPTAGPNAAQIGQETGSETGLVIESPMLSLVEITSSNKLSGLANVIVVSPNSTASVNLQNATTAESTVSSVEAVNLTNSEDAQTNAIDVMNLPETMDKVMAEATNSGIPNATTQIGLENGISANTTTMETLSTTGMTANSLITMNSTNSEDVQLSATDETESFGTANGVLVNFTNLERPTGTTEIGIASGNTTSVEVSNFAQESNEIGPTGETTTNASAAMNSTDQEGDHLNVRPGTMDEFWDNITVTGEPNTTLHVENGGGSIGGRPIAGGLNNATEANDTAFGLQKLEATPIRNISSTPLVTNANSTIGNVIIATSVEGLLEANSGEFLSAEANRTAQAAASSSNFINPAILSSDNGTLYNTAVKSDTATTGNISQFEDAIFDGYSNVETDSNFTDALTETEDDKLLRNTIKHARVPRSKVNMDKEALNPKGLGSAPDVQKTAQRANYRANPIHFSPYKYGQISNERKGMKLGNITYKCYTVRVKGKNKLQINKGCLAVPAEKTACELLADKYGEEALEDCAVCLSGKCNRSYGNGLRFSKLSLALIMLIGYLLNVLLG